MRAGQLLFYRHFSGPDHAIDPLCVCVSACARKIDFE